MLPVIFERVPIQNSLKWAKIVWNGPKYFIFLFFIYLFFFLIFNFNFNFYLFFLFYFFCLSKTEVSCQNDRHNGSKLSPACLLSAITINQSWHTMVFDFPQDYEFHTGKSEYEDILQSNNAPSTMTARGHQSPAAFLVMASGLDSVSTSLISIQIVLLLVLVI